MGKIERVGSGVGKLATPVYRTSQNVEKAVGKTGCQRFVPERSVHLSITHQYPLLYPHCTPTGCCVARYVECCGGIIRLLVVVAVVAVARRGCQRRDRRDDGRREERGKGLNDDKAVV